MTANVFFPYSWQLDDTEEEITSIRIYGLGEDNQNICLRVDNFTPYVYLELPTNIVWNSAKAQLVGNKIDELTGNSKPLSKVFLMKKRLYRAYFDEKGNRKKFPYLFVSFSNKNDIKVLYFSNFLPSMHPSYPTQFSRRSTTVRQTPAWAMEAPMSIDSTSYFVDIRIRIPSGKGEMLSTRPISVTIPVNI